MKNIEEKIIEIKNLINSAERELNNKLVCEDLLEKSYDKIDSLISELPKTFKTYEHQIIKELRDKNQDILQAYLNKYIFSCKK